nr:lytic transglycosylase domain-containing protein [uncultured Flavobacterium sp.]
MKKKRTYKTLSILGIFSIGILFVQFTSEGTNHKSVDVKNHVYFPNNLNFCSEKVPMKIIDVKERLDREMVVNINLHSSTTLILKRANRYFPIIEPILKKNGIPDDFKYLAVIESGLTNATSSAGAKGFWQFMPETAKEYNLEVTNFIDERYDLEKSTEAACEYFKKAYNKFGNWTMVAAAYNRGVNGMQRSINSQGISDYYDLLLTEETSRYVFRVLALKEIMENPDKYGYKLPKDVLYQPIKTKEIAINEGIEDLAKFALDQGINYKILKLHNPWMRDSSLVITEGKTYSVKIPIEGYKN